MMPGTITDDKGAIAPDDVAKLQKHTVTSQNPSEFTTGIRQSKVTACTIKELLLRKFIIGGLAALILIGLADRVNAGCVNLDCIYPGHSQSRCASWTFDSDAYPQSVYMSSPKPFTTERYSDWHVYFKTGDYIDKEWYYFLDEGQYYYLDRTQYKLLGGANYMLGHPCYPKLYERRPDRAAGFTNTRDISWFDSGFFDNLCTGYSVPLSCNRYAGWGCHFKTGDNIEKLRYSYLDKGRYYILDVTQYKWLGGMAYLFESTHYGNMYSFYSPYHSAHDTSDSYHSIRQIMIKKSETEIASIMTEPTIPEPASVLLMTLGTTIITLCRRKR